MVYAKMNRIERPERIRVSKAIAVEMKDGARTYTAYSDGTLSDIVDSTAVYTEFSGASTDDSVHVLCDDGKMYVFQFSQKYGWGWNRMDIGTL